MAYLPVGQAVGLELGLGLVALHERFVVAPRGNRLWAERCDTLPILACHDKRTLRFGHFDAGQHHQWGAGSHDVAEFGLTGDDLGGNAGSHQHRVVRIDLDLAGGLDLVGDRAHGQRVHDDAGRLDRSGIEHERVVGAGRLGLFRAHGSGNALIKASAKTMGD